MKFSWFLVFYAQLVLASSSVEFEDKEASMRLNLYHAQGLDPSISLSDMLAKDEERVKALHSGLANIGSRGTSAGKMGGAELVSIPLKPGFSLGSLNYYVKIGVGTPVKYFSMMVDTGSSLSWLQCQPCTIYCHVQVDPVFNSSTSKTYKRLPCSSSQCSSLRDSTLNDPACETSSGDCVYQAAYGDSSLSIGYLSQDTLSLTPSEKLPNFVFGCGQDNQGLFGRGAGILGLAHDDKLSALAQLSTKYGYAFSYCLPTSSASNTSKGGYLSFGRSSLRPSSYKFTPMVKNPKIPSLYFLDLTAITVARRPLKVAALSYKAPTILDSGTVITRLPMSVYTALRGAFVKIMSKKYKAAPGVSLFDTCFKGNVKEMLGVPEIQIIFRGGASLTLKAHNILLELENGVTCLAFAGSSGNNSIAIIGNYQQQTFNVAYDVSNSKIGFAAGGCQ